MNRWAFTEAITRLRDEYGPASRPLAKTVFEFVLWENVAYLVDEDRRRKAFEQLRRVVGTTPQAIVRAGPGRLRQLVAAGGKLRDQKVDRLIEAAELAIAEFDGDLEIILTLPLPEAKRALARFPAIGQPGAEKILLFLGNVGIMALESNGLRTVVRLGWGAELKNYSATYRSAQAALEVELPSNPNILKDAHLLLRRHGEVRCRRALPQCDGCTLRAKCAYGSGKR